MDSTVASSKVSSRLRDLRRGLVRAGVVTVIVMYTLQVALVVAFLLGLAGSSQGVSVVVEGHAVVPAGSSFVLTASAWAGPGEPWAAPVELRAAVGAEEPRRCREAGRVWYCPLLAPEHAGSFDARVEAWLPGAPAPVTFPVALEAAGVRADAALPGTTGLTASASARGRSLAGRDREPSVRVEGTDSCPWTLAVVPEGGIAVANVLQGYWLHLVDADGAPQAGVPVECATGDEPAVLRGTTDLLGTALVERNVPWEETWSCRFGCGPDAPPVERRVAVNPSWDGIVVAPVRAAGLTGTAAALMASHQRTFGGWYIWLVCDGATVAASAYAVEDGRATFEWAIPAVAGDLRLCALQASTSPRGTPPARTAHWWLLRSSATPERLAVERLAAAVAVGGPDTLRRHVDLSLRGRIATADDGAVSRYGRFVLSALPQPWWAGSILVDGIAQRGEVWEVERRRLGRVAIALLGLDIVLLFAGTALVLLPPALRRRRALLMATDAEADDDSEQLARAGVVSAILAFLLSLGVLAAFIVAMSTLLAAIW